jgi:hypothetical protein
MNNDDFREIPHDELDRVIREALRLDTDTRCLARLEQYWVVQSRRQLWRRRALFVLPAAAAAAILVALLMVTKDGESHKRTAEADRNSAPVQEDAAPLEAMMADNRETDDHSHSAGREPTEYERFVFIARTGNPTASTSLPNKIEKPNRRRDAKPEEIVATIERTAGLEGLVKTAGRTTEPKLRLAIMLRLLKFDSEAVLLGYLSLVRDEATRPLALAAAESAPELPIAELLTRLDHDEKWVRLAAAMVLGHVNGPEVTQSLIARVTEKPSEATEAWLALMACRGAMAEEFLAYASRRPQLLGHLNNARVQWAQAIH